jgi:hypothetical protein
MVFVFFGFSTVKVNQLIKKLVPFKNVQIAEAWPTGNCLVGQECLFRQDV